MYIVMIYKTLIMVINILDYTIRILPRISMRCQKSSTKRATISSEIFFSDVFLNIILGLCIKTEDAQRQ